MIAGVTTKHPNGLPGDEIYERTGVSEDEVEDGLRRQPADAAQAS